MRILYSVVKNISRGGGIEKYTLELGSRLVARGHEVVVFSMGHYGDVTPEVAGMKIVPVPCLKGKQFEKMSAGLSAAVKTLTYSPRDTVVHFHATGPGLYAWLPRLRGFKTVLQMHGIEWQRSRWNNSTCRLLKMIEAGAMRQSHRVTAVSQTQCLYLRDHYGIGAKFIPTGATVKEHTTAELILEWGLRPHQYILFASRLVREKGAHYLIPAFRRLNTEMKLVIAGDAVGEDDYKQELRTLAGGDPRILFPGFVEGRALDELFSNAAFYVQPSELEGLSIALLEAMSYGLCCLVSDIPENREAIGNCGFTFRSTDVEDLAQQMQKLLLLDENAVATGVRATERIRAGYSWDGVAAQFEEFYNELLNS